VIIALIANFLHCTFARNHEH